MQQDKALARTVAGIARRHGNDPSRLLSILHDVQQAVGAVSPAAVEVLADALRIPRTRITAVAGFYAFFHAEPRGRYHILFSDNITDHLLGKVDLMAYLCRKLWVEPGKLSEDGLVYVDSTSCTGLCDQGPAALVNGMAVAALTRQRIDLICRQIQAQRPLMERPQELFEVRDNVHRAGLLLETAFEPGSAMKVALA